MNEARYTLQSVPAYYNENEPNAAQWIRNLIEAGHVAPGSVDDRSIRDVGMESEALRSAVQAHFFAGIAVWSAALRGADWPDDCEVWTGSCPCQPFSSAGRGRGVDDERHLWPEWFRLIRERRPPVIFGEQVASPDGLAWLDLVHDDLEGAGYAVGAVDTCAASVGAPHIRQRLYFVAYSYSERLERVRIQLRERRSRPTVFEASGRGSTGDVGDSGIARGGRDAGALLGAQSGAERGVRRQPDVAELASAARDLADAEHDGRGSRRFDRPHGRSPEQPDRHGHVGALADDDAGLEEARRPEPRGLAVAADAGPCNGAWSVAEWVWCRDGKLRPTEPGTFPLVNGAVGRVAALRAYGNAIVRPLAQKFIEAAIDVIVED